MTCMLFMNKNIEIKINKMTYLNKVELTRDCEYEIKRVLELLGIEIMSFQLLLFLLLFFFYFLEFLEFFQNFSYCFWIFSYLKIQKIKEIKINSLI